MSRFIIRCGAFAALLVLSTLGWAAEQDPAPQATINLPETTNSQPILNAILQLEDRLRSNQLAYEQTTLDAKLVALRNAEALSNGLRLIERALSAQQEAFSTRSAQEMETIRAANRSLLVLGSSFAAVGCLAMLVVAYFQWRIGRVWSGLSGALPVLARLTSGPNLATLGSGEARVIATNGIEEANARLLGAVERLEKRVHELEHASTPSEAPQKRLFVTGDNGVAAGGGNGEGANGSGPSASRQDPRIAPLLKQGQSLLKENQLEEALTVFDQVLSLEPNQTEALVKKGAALERLHKANEAFECYDRAITADRSMTLAYLYKGGLCSRLERFQEALECYEKALRTTHEEGMPKV